MSTLRLEPARVGTLAARDGQGRWYGFDLQLAIYALSLTVIGLLMAFTNSASDPFQPGSIFTRGLIWLSLAMVVFIATAAADHHWLRTFVWPIYGFSIVLLVLTIVVGSGVGGVSRWVSIFGLQFQFSEVAKILLAVVLAHYLATRQSSIGSARTILGAGLITLPLLVAGAHPARPRDVAGLRGHRAGLALHVRREPALADRRHPGCPRDGAGRLEHRAQGLPEAAAHLVPGFERRPTRLWLSAAAVPDHGQLGRASSVRASPTA